MEVSTDGGDTFSDENLGASTGDVNSCFINTNDDVYITDGDHLYRKASASSTYEVLLSSTNIYGGTAIGNLTSVHVDSNGFIYAGSSSSTDNHKLLISTDNGATFIHYDIASNVKDIDVDESTGKIYLTTWDLGLVVLSP